MKKVMKLAALMVCAAATVALTGCGKSNAKLILGKWATDYVLITYSWTNEDGETVTSTEPGDAIVMDFHEDGTLIWTVSNDEDWKSLKAASGSKDSDTFHLTWNLSKDKSQLFIIDDDEVLTFTFNELTETKCVMTSNESGVDEDDGPWSEIITISMRRP